MGQKALAYIRVSSRDQVENFSLPTQRSACLQRAQQDGYELIRVFEDAGASARTADRPALIEMLEFCRVHKGVVQRVYVYSVNRLARRSMDHHAIRATLAKFGIRLMSVTEVLDDSPSGRFLEAVLAAASELDNDQRLAQIVRGMKAATLSGRFPHKAPIGMLNGRKSKGEPSLLPDPVKAPLVREAFERCAAGEDPTAVRRDLERRGLVAYRSKKLPRATFYAMLANKVYAGTDRNEVRGRPR